MYNKRSLMLMSLLFLGSTSDVMGAQAAVQKAGVAVAIESPQAVFHRLIVNGDQLITALLQNMQPSSTLGKIASIAPFVVALLPMVYSIYQSRKNHYQKPIQRPATHIDAYVNYQDNTKKILQTIIEVQKSIEQPEPPNGLGIEKANNNFLLVGEPGTGKSHFAKTILAEAEKLKIKTQFCNVADLLSKFLGETPKTIQGIFDGADGKPLVLVLDEAAILFKSRNRNHYSNSDYHEAITSTFLNCIGSYPNVIVIATVNKVEDIDSALIRDGRLQVIEIVKPRTALEREQILRGILQGRQATINDDAAIKTAAKITRELTPAELEGLICRTRATCKQQGHTQFIGTILIDEAQKTMLQKQRLSGSGSASPAFETEETPAAAFYTNLFSQEPVVDVQVDTPVVGVQMDAPIEFFYVEEEGGSDGTGGGGGGGGGSKE